MFCFSPVDDAPLEALDSPPTPHLISWSSPEKEREEEACLFSQREPVLFLKPCRRSHSRPLFFSLYTSLLSFPLSLLTPSSLFLCRSSPPSSTRSSSEATGPCTRGRRGTSWSSTRPREASSGLKIRRRRRRRRPPTTPTTVTTTTKPPPPQQQQQQRPFGPSRRPTTS